MAGAPIGNRNSADGKEYKQALKRALARLGGSDYQAGLDLVTDKLVSRAANDGEIAAIKEIGERFEGKAQQTTVLAGDAENPLIISEVARKIIE